MVSRGDLRPHPDHQALQQYICAQLRLRNCSAVVYALVTVQGSKRRLPLGPYGNLKTLVEVVEVFQVKVVTG